MWSWSHTQTKLLFHIKIAIAWLHASFTCSWLKPQNHQGKSAKMTVFTKCDAQRAKSGFLLRIFLMTVMTYSTVIFTFWYLIILQTRASTKAKNDKRSPSASISILEEEVKIPHLWERVLYPLEKTFSTSTTSSFMILFHQNRNKVWNCKFILFLVTVQREECIVANEAM